MKLGIPSIYDGVDLLAVAAPTAWGDLRSFHSVHLVDVLSVLEFPPFLLPIARQPRESDHG
jgi:hypothetical protein